MKVAASNYLRFDAIPHHLSAPEPLVKIRIASVIMNRGGTNWPITTPNTTPNTAILAALRHRDATGGRWNGKQGGHFIYRNHA